MEIGNLLKCRYSYINYQLLRRYGGTPQMEVRLKSTKRLMIRTNWDIQVIEYNLREYIESCEIWGDMDLSIDEYNNIKRKIACALGSCPTAAVIKNLFRKYPVTMVSDIINFVLFEFDNNDFWSSWANCFNVYLSVNNHAEVGSMVREIFQTYNFDIIEDGGYTYVTPILCQAGIPCACFNKIFDILDGTLNSPYFDTKELINELRGYKHYLIDVPVERYFRLHTERAIDLIIGLREMMHSLGSVSSFDSEVLPYYAGIEIRIIKQYVEWRAEIKHKGYKSRKSEQYYNPPKLIYDFCKGICLFLPGQVLRQDMIYKLKWEITCDDEETITDFSQVYNIDGRNCTNESYVPINFAKYYRIELFDADDTSKSLTSSWSVSGINEDNPVLAFNESGVLLSQNVISHKGTIIVFDLEKTNISEKQGVQELIDIDLPNSWSNSKAFKVYPAEKGASITLNTSGEEYSIKCKQNFDFEFVQGGTLFGEKFSARVMPVFVKFPTVEINGDIDEYNNSTFEDWQISIIHRLSNTKHTVMLSEIGIMHYNGCARFSLTDHLNGFYEGVYGLYEIKIYDGKTRRDHSFYMSPSIEYSRSFENISGDVSTSSQSIGFYYRDIKAALIEFENDIRVLPTPNHGFGWNQASTKSKGAYINGQIEFIYADNKYKIPFRKTVRDLQWQFWNETQNKLEEYGAKVLYSNELKDFKWKIALHFTDTNKTNNIYNGG